MEVRSRSVRTQHWEQKVGVLSLCVSRWFLRPPPGVGWFWTPVTQDVLPLGVGKLGKSSGFPRRAGTPPVEAHESETRTVRIGALGGAEEGPRGGSGGGRSTDRTLSTRGRPAATGRHATPFPSCTESKNLSPSSPHPSLFTSRSPHFLSLKRKEGKDSESSLTKRLGGFGW